MMGIGEAINLFNESHKYDFEPKIVMDNTKLQLVEEMKLLGVMFTSDLS